MKSILELTSKKLTYTNDQRKALLNIESFLKSLSYKYYILAGFAGSGKTTIAENIVNSARSLGYQVVCCAPTNQAVRVISDKLGGTVECRTLHSLLYGSPNVYGEWVPKKQLSDNTLVLIDESSMITTQLLNDIYEACSIYGGTKAIFIGDSYQLQPVGDDPLLLKNPDSLLTQVCRQKGDSPILDLATKIRTHKVCINPEVTFKDYTLNFDYLESLDKDNLEKSVYVCGTNRLRCKINQDARISLFRKQDNLPLVGDKIIHIANSQMYINGETDLLKEFDILDTINISIPRNDQVEEIEGYLLIEKLLGTKTLFVPNIYSSSLYHGQIENPDKLFPSNWIDKKYIMYPKLSNEVNIATYGYAITAHKSQGSQFSDVYVNQNWWQENARWQYTAVTRAINNLYMANNSYALNITDIKERV